MRLGPAGRRAAADFGVEADQPDHTFDAQRGVIGGSAVPFFALHEDRVFAGKKGQVIEFLASFG